jgi:hypothetical protein
MPRPDNKKYQSLSWLAIPIGIICFILARVFSEMILLSWLYGPRAYFHDGLHIAKYKPHYILSNSFYTIGFSYLDRFFIFMLDCCRCCCKVLEKMEAILDNQSNGESYALSWQAFLLRIFLTSYGCKRNARLSITHKFCCPTGNPSERR